MKISRTTSRGVVYFVVEELDPAHHEAALDLGFEAVGDRFRKGFPAEGLHMDRAYDNFRRCAQEMIWQTAGVRPVPWQEALVAFLRAVEGQGIDWWLTGSAPLAVRGMEVVPRDLDLVVAGADCRRLGDLLRDHLVEPVIPVRDG